MRRVCFCKSDAWPSMVIVTIARAHLRVYRAIVVHSPFYHIWSSLLPRESLAFCKLECLRSLLGRSLWWCPLRGPLPWRVFFICNPSGWSLLGRGLLLPFLTIFDLYVRSNFYLESLLHLQSNYLIFIGSGLWGCPLRSPLTKWKDSQGQVTSMGINISPGPIKTNTLIENEKRLSR